jgi:hypothetical protein
MRRIIRQRAIHGFAQRLVGVFHEPIPRQELIVRAEREEREHRKLSISGLLLRY